MTKQQLTARWKRKNREAQYKHTIARQAEEIEHLRAALAIRTIHDINENNIESLKYIQQHLTVDTFEPRIERKGDRNWMFTWKRPIPYSLQQTLEIVQGRYSFVGGTWWLRPAH